jgi:molybdenum cofactor biosynthesis enzyme
MFTKTIVLLAASLLSSVAVAGNAYVTNDCSFPVYVQHVDQKGSSSLKTIAPRGVYMEAITTNPGAALKVWSTTDMSKPLSELDYTLTNTVR